MAYNQPPFIEAKEHKKHMSCVIMWENRFYDLKIWLQKRISIISYVLGKTSRVSTSQGLRYGLSGNRVIKMVTFNCFL